MPPVPSFAISPEQWLGAALLSTRVMGLLTAAPFFGIGAVPMRVRASLALLIALLLLPVVGLPANPENLGSLGLMTLSELMIGLIIGFIITLFFAGVTIAGEMVGIQTGLSAATAFDPTSNTSMPVIANLLYMSAIAIWFAVGGHMIMLRALADSFSLIGPGESLFATDGFVNLALGFQMSVEVAFRIAAPITAAILLANVAMAVLARTAPQMNVFMLAFPITICFGLFLLGATLIGFGSLVERWALETYALIGRGLSDLLAL